MAVDNIVFNESITYGVSGGPEFNTTIGSSTSGYEKRNQNWEEPLRSWVVGHVIDGTAKLKELLAFYIARRGRAYSFLFRDWLDYSVSDSTEGAMGTGNGSNLVFQLKKTYTDSVRTTVRNIVKPKTSTVKVFVNGVEKTLTTHYTFSSSTGVVTFTPGNAPPNGHAVHWTGEFYIPVRFDSDKPDMRMDGPVAGEWTGIRIVEVRGE